MDAVSESLMVRALELAGRGRGFVEPNPMVGCVIEKGGRVIGEGCHERFGGLHAEANALAACSESPAGSTVYVTLEPCCHTNKKTPPCVNALIQARVGRVVAACVDPNFEVAGKGIQLLRSAGIAVEAGLLEAQAKQVNAAFFVRMLCRRPYVTLKWAQTADGRIAGGGGQRLQISNAASMRVVHELRGRCDAILVGISTALADDPLLTARGVPTCRPLLRVVLDTWLRLPARSRLVRTAGEYPAFAYCSELAPVERIAALESAGVCVRPTPLGASDRLSLPFILDDLHRRQATHVLVEPGPALARSFIEQDLVDRLWVFRSPMRVESADALGASDIPPHWVPTGQIDLDGDQLTEYLNPSSPVYFAADRSADLQLVWGS